MKKTLRPTGRRDYNGNLMEHLVIDGYNMVFADSELNRLARHNLEAGRTRFLDFLGCYTASKKVRVTVVFDGQKGMPGPNPVSGRNLKVVFTQGESADEYIIRRVKKSRRSDQLIVVTSDRAILREVRSRNIPTQTAAPFWKRIRQDVPKSRHKAKEPASEKEIAYWLEKFGDESYTDGLPFWDSDESV